MLSRVALRAARPAFTPFTLRATAVAYTPRFYSKDGNPFRPPKKPSSFDSDPNISPEAQAYSSGRKTESSPVDGKSFLESSLRNQVPSNKQSGYGTKTSGGGESQAASKNADDTADLNSSADAEQPETTQSQPLPDLRHGIPSTFEQEFGKLNSSRTSPAEESEQQDHHDINITEDPTKPNPPPGGGARGGGELPKSAYETSTDRRRNQYMNYSSLIFLLFGTVGAMYYGRNWESEAEERAHPDAPSGWNFKHFWKRIQARWSNQLSYYTEPTFPKLLPDMDPAPPYTLVLSLNDLLIHSEWTREHGWRTAKRPGLDYFLRYLSQYYEIVVFTDLPSTAADPIIKKLDPLRMVIMWPLFREATRYENGEYIKDLSYLNRDLSKVILVDTKKAHAKLQPNNSIILPAWQGTPQDKGLVSLIPFLEYIAAMGIPDVRTAIKSFEGQDIPSEFARREAIAREQFNRQLAEERAKRPKVSVASAVMRGLGMKPQGAVTADGVSLAEGYEQGKMLSDQARERGQKQYEMMEKEIRENGEKWLKELEAEEKKLQEEWMKGMKSSFSFKGMLGGEGSPETGEERK